MRKRYLVTKTTELFQKADGVILVYDVNDPNSWERVRDFWLPFVTKIIEKRTKMILLGNKVDLERFVPLNVPIK